MAKEMPQAEFEAALGGQLDLRNNETFAERVDSIIEKAYEIKIM